MNTICVDDAKKVMQAKDEHGNPVPFSLKAVKLDLDRKTGGEYVTYKYAILCSLTHTHIRVKSPGSSEVRKYRIILITHLNGKEVTV